MLRLKKLTFSNIIIWTMVLFITFQALFPFYIAILASVKSQRDFFSGILSLKAPMSLINYITVLKQYNFLFYLKNSLIVALGAAALTLVLGTLAAYSFSTNTFTGKNIYLIAIIGLRMVPPVSLIIPIFQIASKIGLIDTKLILILIHTALNLPFIIWLLKGFFDEIPSEILQAAKIDGCSSLRTFWNIAVPLITPGLVVAAVFTFIFTWNDFMFALILTSTNSTTLPIMAVNFMTDMGVEWGNLGAAGVLVIIPVLVFSLLTQRWMIKGLTQGGVK